MGKPMLNPRIPPFSVLPNAQTQVSELLQGLGWFGGILSFPFHPVTTWEQLTRTCLVSRLCF